MIVDSPLLNIASWLPRSYANGPGMRMVIWLQGCPFRCVNCQNPDYLDFKINQIVTVDKVWQVFQKIPNLSGISFSGGEPFAQAVALAELAKRVQSEGKTVVCWSGYSLAQLQEGKIKGAIDLLGSIDLLIDGLFREDLAGDDVLRGSSNQQLHFLSGRIQPEELEEVPRQEWIIKENKVTYTGFPID